MFTYILYMTRAATFLSDHVSLRKHDLIFLSQIKTFGTKISTKYTTESQTNAHTWQPFCKTEEPCCQAIIHMVILPIRPFLSGDDTGDVKGFMFGSGQFADFLMTEISERSRMLF